MRKVIAVEDLRKCLSYNAETGEIRWLISRGKARVGMEAGCLDGQGYRIIAINGVLYQAHQIAWALYYGEWSKTGIDHKNLLKSDNRICNIRVATPSENHANMSLSTANTSGRKGVTWNKQSRKWQAGIKVRGKQKHLGLFGDIESAAEAYRAAATEHFGVFARTI